MHTVSHAHGESGQVLGVELTMRRHSLAVHTSCATPRPNVDLNPPKHTLLACILYTPKHTLYSQGMHTLYSQAYSIGMHTLYYQAYSILPRHAYSILPSILYWHACEHLAVRVHRKTGLGAGVCVNLLPRTSYLNIQPCAGSHRSQCKQCGLPLCPPVQLHLDLWRAHPLHAQRDA